MSLETEMSANFAKLKTDAVPEVSPYNLNNEKEINETPVFVKTPLEGDRIIDENSRQDTLSPPVPPRRKKSREKQSSDNINKESTKTNDDDTQTKFNAFENAPFGPINTQANGNVINIVNSRSIQVGPTYTIHSGDSVNSAVNKTSTEKPPKMKASLKAVLASSDACDLVYIKVVSRHLGHGWKDVFRELGYSDGEIEQFYENYFRGGDIKEVIFQLLLDWAQNDPENSNLGKLSTVLWEEGHYEVVKRITSKWKDKCS